MRKPFNWLLVGVIFCIAACGGTQDELLQGQWRGVSATQAGDSLQLDANEIFFQFGEDGIYHYQSTLNYQEAGTYRLQQGILYATDTVHREQTERVVAIDRLNEDSLTIRWRRAGAEQLITLVRE
ncbi:MAG: lipocalin family protein [Bacteroidota bacterium]